MTSEDLASRAIPLLTDRHAGYLRNTLREDGVTCSVCRTPVAGYRRCRPCQSHVQSARIRLADRVCSLIYGVKGTQSGHIMRGYKAQVPPKHSREAVGLLLAVALSLHADCPGRLAGTDVSHWAAVPSLAGRPGEHPLHRLVRPMIFGTEAVVSVATVDEPRSLSDDHFAVRQDLSGAHVLVVDDTWASGGHVQSLALTLRAAGAMQVSVLAIARWLDPGFGGNQSFVRDRMTEDYDPYRCPWTAASCPEADDGAARRVGTFAR